MQKNSLSTQQIALSYFISEKLFDDKQLLKIKSKVFCHNIYANSRPGYGLRVKLWKYFEEWSITWCQIKIRRYYNQKAQVFYWFSIIKFENVNENW